MNLLGIKIDSCSNCVFLFHSYLKCSIDFFWFSVTFILKRLTGRTFKVFNFKFVIHHGRIFFGKRPIRVTVSKNKRFPGYFTFTLNKVVYYIKFTLRGLIIFGVRGHKVVKTTVLTHSKKIVIKHPKKHPKNKGKKGQ